LLDLSPEITALEQRGLINAAASAKLCADETRAQFSLWPELRFLTWTGVIAIVTGVGLVLKEHAETIGDLALATVILLVALACYYVGWRKRAAVPHSLLFDYLPLLGALLVSADVAFLESRYHIFDEHWRWHLMLLAVLHGSVAYWLHHKQVFSLAILSIAGWAGVDEEGAFWGEAFENAVSLFQAGGVTLLIAIAHRWRLERWREFRATAEGFAAHFLVLGALILSFDDTWRWAGVALTLALGAVMFWWGWRERREGLAIFSVIYMAIAVEVAIIDLVNEAALAFLFILVINPILLVGLYIIHRRWSER